MLLVAMPGAPSSVLVPSSDALLTSSFLLLLVMASTLRAMASTCARPLRRLLASQTGVAPDAIGPRRCFHSRPQKCHGLAITNKDRLVQREGLVGKMSDLRLKKELPSGITMNLFSCSIPVSGMHWRVENANALDHVGETRYEF